MDLYQTVTDSIIRAIEAGAGDFKMPWRGASGARPVNSSTGAAYNGVNIISLWMAQQEKGYSCNQWATYKQWEAQGAQVRKGEKASHIVFFKQVTRETDEGEESFPMLRGSAVFNAEQVEGFTIPTSEAKPVFNLSRADEIIAATKAIIRHQGSQAFYRRTTDEIYMPDRTLFHGTETRDATESYYSVLLHEITHWTGAETRLKREFGKRFGDNAYAMEELVAELGAAFLCADLGVTQEPRQDHAQYIQNWLQVLKADKKAIFTAASQASKAASFVLESR